MLKIILSYIAILGPLFYQFLKAWHDAGYPTDIASLVNLVLVVIASIGTVSLNHHAYTYGRNRIGV